MIEVIKQFYKLSEKKTYLVGEKVNFGKEENKSLVDNGFAKPVKEDKRKKIKIDKK